MNLETLSKYKKLVLGILFDALGFVTFFIPGIGEFADVIWAPASAYLMTKLYKGRPSKVAAVVSFVEEILPFTDVIPTFTLMWLYTYKFSSERKQDTLN
ncbi:hypothetical protein [Sediminibacter sp. Hel_I_10]|uniref:hypothetical protein n=1 Tax=Sediminibacter sp. Hel_I_10 TaxID=1392490 RepID=UPI000479CD16|nr:hypothetical protein [Sediminibacter sp. Hel_I_10]